MNGTTTSFDAMRRYCNWCEVVQKRGLDRTLGPDGVVSIIIFSTAPTFKQAVSCRSHFDASAVDIVPYGWPRRRTSCIDGSESDRVVCCRKWWGNARAVRKSTCRWEKPIS